MNGKEICKAMKKTRAEIAKLYDIPGFEYKECTFDGECEGHCPACDAETKELERLVKEKRMNIEQQEVKQKSDMTMGYIIDRRKEEITPEIEEPIILSGKVTPPMPMQKEEDEKLLLGDIKIDPNYDEDPFDRDRAHNTIIIPRRGKISETKHKPTYEDKNPNKKGLSKFFRKKK
jgi:hypothetical protein